MKNYNKTIPSSRYQTITISGNTSKGLEAGLIYVPYIMIDNTQLKKILKEERIEKLKKLNK